MQQVARGTFDVQLTPQPQTHPEAAPMLWRLRIDKQFHGALEGTSAGEMLSARTAVADSAGYVALEHVSGTLDGRAGSFVLQHSGTMTRGRGELSVTVVPDSGTGELEGLSGSMTITITEHEHQYELSYTFEQPAGSLSE